jgi:hypothetical protein
MMLTMTPTTTDRTFVSVRITAGTQLAATIGHEQDDTVDMLGLDRAIEWANVLGDDLDVTIRDVGNDLVILERINGTWSYRRYNID